MIINVRVVIPLILLVLVIGTVTGANFTSNETRGVEGAAFQFTDTSAGSQTGWSWFFGDEGYNQLWTQQTNKTPWKFWRFPEILGLSDNSVLLAGGAPGYYNGNHTWISYNDGSTWSNITATAPAMPSREYAGGVVFPNDTIVVFGGLTADGFTYSAGMPASNDTWKSIDKGVTWTLVNASCGWSQRWRVHGFRLPDDSIVMLSDGSADVWRSTDMGAHWTRMTANHGMGSLYYPATTVTSNGTIFVMGGQIGGNYNNKTWASTNGGATWTTVNASSGWEKRSEFTAGAPADGSIIIAGGKREGYSAVDDVWKSTDNGTTWSKIADNVGLHAGLRGIPSPIVTLKDARLLEIAYENVQISSDNGTSWNKVSYIPEHNQTGYLFNVAPLYFPLSDGSIIITTGGTNLYSNTIWKSTNLGVDWTLVKAHADWQGRDEFGFVRLSSGEILVINGETDVDVDWLTDSVWLSPDNGLSWVLQNETGANESCNINRCVGAYGATVVLSDDSIVTIGGEVGVDWEENGDVWISTDKGLTWTQQTNSSAFGTRSSHVATVLSDDSIVVTGGYDEEFEPAPSVWISSDRGVTWTEQTADSGFALGESNFVTLPDDTLLITSGYSGDMNNPYSNETWISHDRGVTWEEIASVNTTYMYSTAEASTLMADGSVLLYGGGASFYPGDLVQRFNPVSSTERNPVHTYTDEGLYRVSVQVHDALTTSSVTKSDYINITNRAPNSSFTSTNGTGYRPLTVTFTDTSTFSPSNWDWYIGANKVSDDQNVAIVFDIDGVYDIKLYTSNTYGGSWDNQTGIIQIGTAPAEGSLQVDENSQFYDSMESIFATFNLGIILLGLVVVVMALCIVMRILAKSGMMSDTINVGGINIGVTEFTGILMAVMVIGLVGIMIITT